MVVLAVLDTSSLAAEPAILSLSSERIVFLAPWVVDRELSARSLAAPGARALRQYLMDAAGAGKIMLGKAPPGAAAGGDVDVVAYAVHWKLGAHSEERVVLVSEDAVQRLAAGAAGLEAKSARQFLAEHGVGRRDNAMVARAAVLAREQNSFHIRSAIGGASIIGLIWALWGFREQLWDSAPVWSPGPLALFAGLVLYCTRQRYRMAYGIAECGVGALGAYLAGIRFTPGAWAPAPTFAFVGAVYVVVRGLDNIGKGIDGTRFSSRWISTFGKIG